MKNVIRGKVLGPNITGGALIRGVTIVGESMMMDGVEDKARVSVSLSSSSGVHLILTWGPPAAALSQHMQRDDESRK